jgi:hypothetical protein
MRKRITLSAIGATGLIIGLAACGGRVSSAPQHTAQPSAPALTAAPSPTLPATTPESATPAGTMQESTTPAGTTPATSGPASAAASETCALTPSCPASTAPAAGTGVSPAWMTPTLQTDIDKISASFARIHKDISQLDRDANAQNTGVLAVDGAAVGGDGLNLSTLADFATEDAKMDSGVPAGFQTAMSDFAKGGDAISFIGGPVVSGDYATVNADINKLNAAAKQGQATLTAALGS